MRFCCRGSAVKESRLRKGIIMGQIKELTFSDLRVHFRTGRSYVISGSGKDRKYGYRNGIRCNAGDLELSEWRREVKALIQRSGEQVLYGQLYGFMLQRNYCGSSKTELEDDALQLYVSRIFDNEAWIYFVEFNRLYRPEVLQEVAMRLVKTDCCAVPGWVTQARIDMAGSRAGKLPCPICGKWSSFEYAEDDKERKEIA